MQKNFDFIRLFKIIILNILLIGIIICATDFLVYLKNKSAYIKNINNIKIFPPISYVDNYKAEFSIPSLKFQTSNKNNLNYFRKTNSEDYKNKKSILIFGCSYAFSFGLDNDKTINAKLSKKTKRTVYNFGICSGGIQHMLAFLKNKKLYENIKIPPEYAIYIYIPSHLERLQANIFPNPMMTNGLNLKYKLEKDSLRLEKQPFNDFSKSFIVKSLYYQADMKRNNFDNKNKQINAKLAEKIFIDSKKTLEEYYPNIKFVILKYEVENDNAELLESDKIWSNLEKESFKIIKTSDLVGRKFKYHSKDTTNDYYHPSEYAWDTLVPYLVNELNL